MTAKPNSPARFLAATALVFSTSLSAQNEWPTYQANPAHDGVLPISIDPISLKHSWSVKLATSQLGSPCAANSQVYVTGGDKKLRTVDASTGALLWERGFSGAFSVNPPAYANGRVYMQTCNHSSDTYLRCFDAEDGTTIFNAPHAAQWGTYLAPTIADNVAYVNGGSYGGMYAFDATSGSRLWFRALAQYDAWTPAVDAKYAYAYVGGTLSALDRPTGNVVYSIADPNYNWSGYSMDLAPVLAGQDDVLVVYGRRLVRFDLSGRKIHYDIDANFSGQVAVRNGVIYALASGIMQARKQSDGSLMWGFGVASQNLKGEVILTNEHALVRSSTHTYVVDLKTHTQVWSIAEAGNLCVAQGAIFIARADGTLTCVRFAEMPTLSSCEPSRLHYARAMSQVVLRGSAFSGHGQPEVWFDSQPATNVVLVDDKTITCTPPAGAPGSVPVTVGNGLGRRRLDNGFVYYPAQFTTGDHRLNGVVDLTYECETGDQILGLIGIPALPGPYPPFTGDLELSAIFPFVSVLFNFGSQFSISVQIPNDPALRGQAFGLQALAGSQLGANGGAFTNMDIVNIR